jgi:RNA polymerase sigma factor (sigma-70 family)
MAETNLGAVVNHLRRLVGLMPTEESDARLLDRFLASRDEAAFAALMRRHGAMVMGVCRRLLERVEDAEDVLQATFLLLARKAPTIRRRASLGCWLHGVAHRLSVQLKRREKNRLAFEKRLWAMGTRFEAASGSEELQRWLDEALLELPEKYRTAVILCSLEGKATSKRPGCWAVPSARCTAGWPEVESSCRSDWQTGA